MPSALNANEQEASKSPAWYLPHRPPMIFLNAITQVGDDWLEAEVDHAQRGPFSEERGTPIWVAVEYMAQAISAYAGAKRRAVNKLPKVGFLLGTREFSATQDYFEHNQTITIRVEAILQSDSGVSLFKCTIQDSQGHEICHAELKGIQPENPQELALSQLSTATQH